MAVGYIGTAEDIAEVDYGRSPVAEPESHLKRSVIIDKVRWTKAD